MGNGRCDDLPLRRVTPNQIVGWNIAYYRKASGLTQEDFGKLIGWSNATVSAAERSWDGKRIREFDATTLLALAAALNVPIAALLTPPQTDGETLVLDMPAPGLDGAGMGSLFGYLFPDPGEERSPVLDAYREAFTAAARAYDPARGEDIARYLDDMTEPERRAGLLERLSWQSDAMRAVLADLEDTMTQIRKAAGQ